jgi:hypothetical protein
MGPGTLDARACTSVTNGARDYVMETDCSMIKAHQQTRWGKRKKTIWTTHHTDSICKHVTSLRCSHSGTEECTRGPRRDTMIGMECAKVKERRGELVRRVRACVQ